MGNYYYHTNNKKAVLAYPCPSDPAFEKGATIFGRKQDGLSLRYADRLRQQDRDKYEIAWSMAVAECGKGRTAKRIEVFLRHYYNNHKIEIKCIISGIRPFDDCPWYVYGYTTE